MKIEDVEKPKYKIGDLVVANVVKGETPTLIHRQIMSAWFHLDDEMNQGRGWEYSFGEKGDFAYEESCILYKLN